ncbi:MAG: helix-turn-helix domain-containing protein [Pseudonocardiaceae bacterium]
MHRIAHQREPDGLTTQTGNLTREHWIVPVYGLSPADSDGIVQAIARRDGTVILHLTCGHFQTKVLLDVSTAAQLSTGVWEAAGAAQQLTGYPPRISSPRPCRRPTPVNDRAAMVADEMRTIGRRIRRIRQAKNKSLRVIAGLAGMSTSTLHRIERGQREMTLSEVAALANALHVAHRTLIRWPALAPADGTPALNPGGGRPAAG